MKIFDMDNIKANRNLVILKLYVKPILISVMIAIVYYLYQVLETLISKISFSKVPFHLILNFLYYNIGWIISLAIPFAFLISTIFVFAQLPYKNIYEEFKYKRHSFSYFLLPFGFIAILLSIALYFYDGYTLPSFNYKSSNTLLELSRISDSPKGESGNIDIHGLPRSDIEMNFSMLTNKRNYLLKLKESSKEKSERIYDSIIDSINRTEIEIQKRYAISFSPFFLMIFAIPLGFLIRNKKTLIILTVGLISWTIYYQIFNFFSVLVPTSNPIFIWISNIIYLIIGVILFVISNIKLEENYSKT
jgi:lipopolysaccharide export LptBFGC system permease protein LptF